MKHFAKIFAIITISLTATAVDCYKYDSDIAFTLHNDSDKTIGWYIPTYEEFLEGVMPDEMPNTLAKSHYHISPGKSHTFIRGKRYLQNTNRTTFSNCIYLTLRHSTTTIGKR